LLQIILHLANPWPSFTALACRVQGGLASPQVVIMLLSVNRSCMVLYMWGSCAGRTSPTRAGRTSAAGWCSSAVSKTDNLEEEAAQSVTPPTFRPTQVLTPSSHLCYLLWSLCQMSSSTSYPLKRLTKMATTSMLTTGTPRPPGLPYLSGHSCLSLQPVVFCHHDQDDD
jgi:hypothetical protein